MSKPLYVYDKLGTWWYVFKMKYIGTSSYGEKCSEAFTKEEAEKETYKLNNWTLKK